MIMLKLGWSIPLIYKGFANTSQTIKQFTHWSVDEL